MTKITTQDCKDFLIKEYKKNNINTNYSQWKRTRKYKVANNFHRDFEHPEIGVVTIKEDNGNLEIVSKNISNHSTTKKVSLSSLYKGICDDSGDKLVSGSVKKTIESFLEESEDYEYISSENNEDDGYGTYVSAYYYHCDGRDISLFVYKDNSWVITSD